MQKGHYNFLDKILHRLALQNTAFAEMSFDLNLRLYKHEIANVSPLQHIFIAGLARSGTTILMRQLYDTVRYRSLTYQDMPFVLAPNIWQKFSSSSHKSYEQSERMHGDGIKISPDSPEALEEVFWRIFTGSEYIKKDRLIPYHVSQEIIAKFRQYVSLIILSGKTDAKFYLSKNNNNILRLPAIRKAFPSALILVPFRNPLTHANSLFYQHKLFIKLQNQNQFTRKYMDWLGHFEFGSGHKIFDFGNQSSKNQNIDDFNYWLDLWINTYDGIRNTASKDVHFICYEDLCKNKDVWKNISHLAGIEKTPVHNFILREKEIVEDIDKNKLDKAFILYESLRNKT
ncbi:MAG: sulfotransferase [Kordiimonadaceae bacterium]|nr:sulfotransferase [Kordiimonadaceae bacterium]